MRNGTCAAPSGASELQPHHLRAGRAAIRTRPPQEGLPLTAPVDSARRQEPASLDRVLPPRAQGEAILQDPSGPPQTPVPSSLEQEGPAM